MRVPLSWLSEYAALPEGVGAADVARRLTSIGLEIEAVEPVGHDVTGVVVARVLEIEELADTKKPIRYCRVDTGTGERQMICGAVNFAAGDLVPLALPGATLPGGLEIGAKRAYGRLSDGMICSPDELGIGDDHAGILVLPPDAPLGADFAEYAGLADTVLEVNVTPDKGHALSVRGMARELAIAYGAAFNDPADAALPAWAGGGVLPGAAGSAGAESGAAEGDEVYPASIADPTACDRFVLREVRGIDPAAPVPLPIRVRLARAGIRSVSLAVDVTNYLMVELGQPLHAFDRSALRGPIVVRRARQGERLETLDHVVRKLDPDDILITDSSGPISMAGTMGGLATEVTADSVDLVIEAAHFSAPGTARMSRRHRLFSEASARFERGVDYELQPRASARAAAMLAALGGGTVVPGMTYAAAPIEPVRIVIPADHPDKVAGVRYGAETVISRLRDVGCDVQIGDLLTVTPPSWRPDLTDPNDLAEEVIRFEGYDKVGIAMPRAAAGRGRTARQRLRGAVGRALAGAGYVEVISGPFSSTTDFDRLLLIADDVRRHAVTIANPIRDEEPLFRTTLLPGLFRVAGRNAGRGFADLALFEIGNVARLRTGKAGGAGLAAGAGIAGAGIAGGTGIAANGIAANGCGGKIAPILAVDRAPTEAEIAELESALPDQPRLVAVVLTGLREPAGWWGAGRAAGFEDAIEAARLVLATSRLPYQVRASQREPWHPGRCAEFVIGEGQVVGFAGELHPRVCAAFKLASRACAMELDLSAIERAAEALPPAEVPPVSGFPVATQDVALVVSESVPASDIEQALVAGAAEAGSPLEQVRLFDVYTGDQVGPGRKSLAYTLRFRAPDRTLTDEEVAVARDAAVAEAARRTGAVLRGA